MKHLISRTRTQTPNQQRPRNNMKERKPCQEHNKIYTQKWMYVGYQINTIIFHDITYIIVHAH